MYVFMCVVCMYSCVCVYTWVCVHTCLCLWVKRPEVDVGCLPQSWWHGLSLVNTVFQVNCLAPGVLLSTLPQWVICWGYMCMYLLKNKKKPWFLKITFTCVCVCVHAHVLVYVHVVSMTCTWSSEASLQVSGVGCLLLAFGCPGLNSDHQVGQQSTFISWANSLALCLTFYVRIARFELSSLCLCGKN